MSIAADTERGIFCLEGKNSSYLFDVCCGTLRHLYFGEKIGRGAASGLVQARTFAYSADFADRSVPKGSCPETMPQEYSGNQNGDFRTPGAVPVQENGSCVCDWHYRSCGLLPELPALKGLPFARGGETLAVTLADEAAGVEAVLYYTPVEECDAVLRHVVLRNIGTAPVRLDSVQSFCLDFQDRKFDILTLNGRHAAERGIDRHPLSPNTETVASLRGASSHQHNPAVALLSPGADETRGDAYGFLLVYSGDFRFQAETDSLGQVRVTGGIHPDAFSWALAPGEEFTSPQSILVYSPEGLGGMSRRCHDLLRNHLIRNFAFRPRPVVLNSWEAAFFRFDEEKLLGMIDSAKGTGIDTFVLDDGWFGHRDSDNSSLGDWFADRRKLPHGLAPLAARCRENGMRFGIWIEPEMISEDSELFRAHPDWAVGAPGRQPVLSRNQMILDMTRPEVLACLKDSLGKLLSSGDISYVKWDMNRNIAENFSLSLPADRRKEFAHRYQLGVYELAAYLTERYPEILFEGCCGGGGRFDAGMLYYFPQIWCSDNTDAEERTRIQYGTSIFYPLSSMTSHVSAAPNMESHRNISMQTRGCVCETAVPGYELDLRRMPEEELRMISAQTARWRRAEHTLLCGDCYRLENPFESNFYAVQVMEKNRRNGYAVFFFRWTRQGQPLKRLRFQGLESQTLYRVTSESAPWAEGVNLTADGASLMRLGLQIPRLKYDCAALWFDLSAEENS